MKRTIEKISRRQRRKRGIRKGAFGVPERPRLTVYRSNRHIYAQVIDDLKGHTIASASTDEKSVEVASGGNCNAATDVGKRIAQRAVDAGCAAVVFDRNGYRYHGRVRALADAAREAGLKF